MQRIVCGVNMPEFSFLDRSGDTTSGEFNQPEYATDQFPVVSTMERKNHP